MNVLFYGLWASYSFNPLRELIIMFFDNDVIELTEPVFRPPSEAQSLILQVTNGCSWNRCSFCEMYTEPQKKFSVKSSDKVLEEIKRVGRQNVPIRKVFLGDGDALVLSTRRLMEILEAIKKQLPQVSRVSAYCLPRNLVNKTPQELRELRELGLSLIYVGAETGNDELLAKINKGETRASTVEALSKAKDSGIKSSVMIINGLGGVKWSKAHAADSALMVNAAQPDYLSTLVLFHPRGEARFLEHFGSDYTALGAAGLCGESADFIEQTELHKTVFRSDHVSNHLVLKGILGRDREALVSQAREAVDWFTRNPERQPHGY